MDRYVTGSVIRRLRENKKLTQEELAEKIYVSGKAVRQSSFFRFSMPALSVRLSLPSHICRLPARLRGRIFPEF